LQRKREENRQARLAKEKAEREYRDKADAIALRNHWRRYARKNLLPPSAGPIRVALRVPASSERHVRNFYPGPSTLPLFIYADTLLIPAEYTPDRDPDWAPPGYTPPDDFRIVTNYPRKEIERMEEGGEAVWDTVKQAGGALFAEKKENGTWAETEGDSDEEDE
jgi:FAS-associated factor 2